MFPVVKHQNSFKPGKSHLLWTFHKVGHKQFFGRSCFDEIVKFPHKTKCSYPSEPVNKVIAIVNISKQHPLKIKVLIVRVSLHLAKTKESDLTSEVNYFIFSFTSANMLLTEFERGSYDRRQSN